MQMCNHNVCAKHLFAHTFCDGISVLACNPSSQLVTGMSGWVKQSRGDFAKLCCWCFPLPSGHKCSFALFRHDSFYNLIHYIQIKCFQIKWKTIKKPCVKTKHWKAEHSWCPVSGWKHPDTPCHRWPRLQSPSELCTMMCPPLLG